MNAYSRKLPAERAAVAAGPRSSAGVCAVPVNDQRAASAQLRSWQAMANNSASGRQLAAAQAAVHGRRPARPAAQLQADEQAQAVAQRVRSTELRDPIKPGPPPTYRVGSKFFKKFNRQEKAATIHKNWIDAYIGGLPTPNFGMEQVEDTTDWVFWAEQAKGDVFFQFSKPGHTDKVAAWINKQPTGYLIELEQVFTNYLVGDAQGFFEDQAYGKIEFIDVQKKVSGGPMKDMGDLITARLNQG
jgi:hypothetical protein